MPNISRLFNKTVSTLRGTTTITEGSASTEFITNISALKCRIQGSDSTEPVQAGRKYSKPARTLFCAYGTDLVEEDKVVYNGTTYNVISTNPEENKNTYLEVQIEKGE